MGLTPAAAKCKTGVMRALLDVMLYHNRRAADDTLYHNRQLPHEFTPYLSAFAPSSSTSTTIFYVRRRAVVRQQLFLRVATQLLV